MRLVIVVTIAASLGLADSCLAQWCREIRIGNGGSVLIAYRVPDPNPYNQVYDVMMINSNGKTQFLVAPPTPNYQGFRGGPYKKGNVTLYVDWMQISGHGPTQAKSLAANKIDWYPLGTPERLWVWAGAFKQETPGGQWIQWKNLSSERQCPTSKNNVGHFYATSRAFLKGRHSLEGGDGNGAGIWDEGAR
jgi:hypothetical protein